MTNKKGSREMLDHNKELADRLFGVICDLLDNAQEWTIDERTMDGAFVLRHQNATKMVVSLWCSSGGVPLLFRANWVSGTLMVNEPKNVEPKNIFVQLDKVPFTWAQTRSIAEKYKKRRDQVCHAKSDRLFAVLDTVSGPASSEPATKN